MNTQVGSARVELLKKWIENNKEYLMLALSTEKAEIVLFMKGSSIKSKITQYPPDNKKNSV